MHFQSALSTVLTVISLASSAHAWAQKADGTWVANNNIHTINGKRYHEACTYRNTNNVHKAGDNCAFWADSKGTMLNGSCGWFDATYSFLNCNPF